MSLKKFSLIGKTRLLILKDAKEVISTIVFEIDAEAFIFLYGGELFAPLLIPEIVVRS